MGKLKRDFALGYVLGMNNVPTPEPEPSTPEPEPSTDDWTPPSDWLQLPPAESGEMTILVDNSNFGVYFTLSSVNSSAASVTVDWGDGTVEAFTSATKSPQHIYTMGSGHIVANGISQFVMKIYNISSNANITGLHDYVGCGVLSASINTDISNMVGPLNTNTCLCNIDILDGTVIPSSFCGNCPSLKTVNIYNGITEIRGGAFAQCTGLYILDFSKTKISSIPNYCCQNNTSLYKVILPNTVTFIGAYAFKNCTALSYINIPMGCKIGTLAFQNCPSLYSQL